MAAKAVHVEFFSLAWDSPVFEIKQRAAITVPLKRIHNLENIEGHEKGESRTDPGNVFCSNAKNAFCTY